MSIIGHRFLGYPDPAVLCNSLLIKGVEKAPSCGGWGPSLCGWGLSPVELVGVVLFFGLSTAEVAADRFGAVAGNDS